MDFIRGFACADICYARDGWHARSFDAEFGGGGVGCRSALQLCAECGVECWVMAIQPTERGKQVKRPPSYYLNDLSLLIFEDLYSEKPRLVKARIGGARRDVACSVVLESGRVYTVVPVSFRASRGSFVLRLYSASPVQVHEAPPAAQQTWAALHQLLVSPEPPLKDANVWRRAQDFGVGQLLVVEGPAMALGVLVNLGPVMLKVDLCAFGNHAALRSPLGMLEGSVDESRNQQEAKKKPTTRQSRPSKATKADWREHHLQVLVPAFSQRLAFVAVALLEKNWDFSLESLNAEQLSEADPVEEPAGHPFAPVPLALAVHATGLDKLEELEEMELQAALRESVLHPECDSDPELELALSMSLMEAEASADVSKAAAKVDVNGTADADASVNVDAHADANVDGRADVGLDDQPRRRGRWMRRSRQT